MPPQGSVRKLNVMKRTDVGEAKKSVKNVTNSDSTVRTCYSKANNQTTLFFQRPSRKTAALTTARVENAMVMAMNTPRAPIPNTELST